MTEFNESVASILSSWLPISLGLGFLGVIILLFVRVIKPENPRFMMIGIVLFGQTFISGFILMGVHSKIETNARNEVKVFLHEPELVVRVNKEIIDSTYGNKIISELKKIQDLPPHHSHPTEMTELEIVSKTRTIRIRLAKDSEIESEYWVFWDKYGDDEIGRIKTNVLK